jgi:isopenicillin N synthase-like dioxygenase
MTEVIQLDPVVLDYNDLVNNVDLSQEIKKAFGFDGAGLLVVKNVPGFVEARGTLLPISKKFAELEDSVKEKYVKEDTFYSFGWSHGKEKLQGGKPDTSKGSYYNNPQYDKPIDDPKIIAEYPAFAHPNIWPTEDMPEMENAFKTLGQLMVKVGTLVARQCDTYISSMAPLYSKNSFETVIETSKCCKARLLHYYPMNQEEIDSHNNSSNQFSSWCGWHNDHGSLTGLTSAMYMDSNGNVVQNTDPQAGLYVRNRKSELLKVNIPVDCIGFQIGETAQVHSGGLLQATPHAVRGSNCPNISRESFAVFMEPMWDAKMVIPEGMEPDQAQSASAAENLPPGVPKLHTRWRHDPTGTNPQTFGEFTEITHKSYY